PVNPHSCSTPDSTGEPDSAGTIGAGTSRNSEGLTGSGVRSSKHCPPGEADLPLPGELLAIVLSYFGPKAPWQPRKPVVDVQTKNLIPAPNEPHFDVVALASSAGGLKALSALLSALPSDF